MLKSKRVIMVDTVIISGDDAEKLRELCSFIESSAQSIIDDHPNESAEVQNRVTFCRNILKEFR